MPERTCQTAPDRLSTCTVVVPIAGGNGFPYLHQRHRKQIDRGGQTKPARPLRGPRQIARQLLELVSP